MLRTPATVLTSTGRTAERNTMKIFEALPMPNQMMNSG